MDNFERFENARNQRDSAMSRVDANANERWKEFIFMIIHEMATVRYSFTADDIWYLLEKLSNVPWVHDKRALGPSGMKASQFAGFIEPTGLFKRSTRRHLTYIMIWRSKLYKGGFDGRGVNSGPDIHSGSGAASIPCPICAGHGRISATSSSS